MGPAVSELLRRLLPEELWVYREMASIMGAQRDFDEAKHLSCILREDLETREEEKGECLVLASGLMQRHWLEELTYAEVLFELDSEGKKLDWLRK